MYSLRHSAMACAGLLVLLSAVALVTPRAGFGQKSAAQPNAGLPTQNVNVVNTPSVNVQNPLVLAAGASVDINSSAASPVFVREARATALAFQALGASFVGTHDFGTVDVSPYQQIRVVARSNALGFRLKLSVIEAGRSVGTFDTLDVPGCFGPGGGGCAATDSVTRVYDVPGRTIGITAIGPGEGDVLVFGR